MDKNDFSNFKMPKIDIPKIDMPKVKIPEFNFDVMSKEMQTNLEQIEEANRRKHDREVQNNENLKKIVDYNSDITEYNKQLVDLNKSILTKINSVNTSLDFILESIQENTEVTKKDSVDHNALLLELIKIMESKDKDKIKNFLGSLTGNVAAGLTVEYLKYKLGIS